MIIIATHSKQFRQIIFFILLVIVLFLVEFVEADNYLRKGSLWLLSPVQKVSARVVHIAQQPVILLQHASKSARRVQDLEMKYAAASAALGELDSLREENQALKELLENSDRTLDQSSVVTAPIVSFSQPTIAAGSDHGVVEGAVVLSAQTLLGRVTKVDSTHATITLLSQQNSHPLLATTESGVQGLVVGDGRRALLTELPISETVEKNERVVTVGQKGVKRGLFIGRVVEVISEPSASSQTAILEPFVSFYESVIVEVQ